MASIKKHVRQMTNAEMTYLLKKARSASFTDTMMTPYAAIRVSQRGGTIYDALHALHTGTLIEYHKKDGRHRILVRGTKKYGKDIMCVVLDIESNEVITCYYNRHDDNHYTLNESAYNRTVNVLKELGVA